LEGSDKGEKCTEINSKKKGRKREVREAEENEKRKEEAVLYGPSP